MAKTYRITSETVNFSLITPDSTTYAEAKADMRQVAQQILDQQAEVIQRNQLKVAISLVSDEEEEDASIMLGKLVADYYRNS